MHDDMDDLALDDYGSAAAIERAGRLKAIMADRYCWSPSMVKEAIRDAIITLNVVERAPRPKGMGGAWVPILREWHDFIGVKDTPPVRGGTIDAAQISRMETALSWPAQYLRCDDNALRAVMAWMASKALRVPFGRFSRIKLNIQPRTAIDRRDRGLLMIAAGLARDEVDVLPFVCDGPPQDGEDQLSVAMENASK